jgi:hypothetical protein
VSGGGCQCRLPVSVWSGDVFAFSSIVLVLVIVIVLVFPSFFCLSGVRLGDDAAWRAQSGKPRFDGASPYQTARPGVARTLNAKR